MEGGGPLWERYACLLPKVAHRVLMRSEASIRSYMSADPFPHHALTSRVNVLMLTRRFKTGVPALRVLRQPENIDSRRDSGVRATRGRCWQMPSASQRMLSMLSPVWHQQQVAECVSCQLSGATCPCGRYRERAWKRPNGCSSSMPTLTLRLADVTLVRGGCFALSQSRKWLSDLISVMAASCALCALLASLNFRCTANLEVKADERRSRRIVFPSPLLRPLHRSQAVPRTVVVARLIRSCLHAVVKYVATFGPIYKPQSTLMSSTRQRRGVPPSYSARRLSRPCLSNAYLPGP